MPMQVEQRNGVRRRTLRAAKIVYGDYRYIVDCVVRDASPEGMRIRCDYVREIPQDFFIFDPTEQTLRKAEVMWRRENELGLHFNGDPVNIHQSNDPRHARFRFM